MFYLDKGFLGTISTDENGQWVMQYDEEAVSSSPLWDAASDYIFDSVSIYIYVGLSIFALFLVYKIFRLVADFKR